MQVNAILNGILASADQGETLTVEFFCSASGSYFPPCLILPRKRKHSEFELCLPPGSMVEISDKRYFFIWFKNNEADDVSTQINKINSGLLKKRSIQYQKNCDS